MSLKLPEEVEEVRQRARRGYNLHMRERLVADIALLISTLDSLVPEIKEEPVFDELARRRFRMQRLPT